MPNNKLISYPLDTKKINIDHPCETNYWCKRFNCTKDELVDAVQAVGTSALAVEIYLRKNQAE